MFDLDHQPGILASSNEYILYFFHLMFSLVLLLINVLDLSSSDVPLRADTLCLADHARIRVPSWFAGPCSFIFDQTLLDQLVAGNLKAVEVPNTDAALEEASILRAKSCKFAHFLDNRV